MNHLGQKSATGPLLFPGSTLYEALVAIDINSGQSTKQTNIEKTAVKMKLNYQNFERKF